MAYLRQWGRLCICSVKAQVGERGCYSQWSSLCIWQKQACFSMCHLHCSLMQHRIVFYQQPAMTLSKYLTHGGISHSIWVCINCKKAPPPNLISFHQPWKYLSWIPFFSCNSPSSCFTVSGCQQCVWFISQVLVGQGLPHGTPGPGGGWVPEGQAKPQFPRLGRL